MGASVVSGCVIRARPVGAIEAEQKAKGEEWQRNDRLIAVATHAQTHETVESLEDLRPHLLDEIKAFFIEYNRLRGSRELDLWAFMRCHARLQTAGKPIDNAFI
jgi:inorganic pyrophosphatase